MHYGILPNWTCIIIIIISDETNTKYWMGMVWLFALTLYTFHYGRKNRHIEFSE